MLAIGLYVPHVSLRSSLELLPGLSNFREHITSVSHVMTLDKSVSVFPCTYVLDNDDDI
jgi:hypothetical protein